MQAVNAIGYGAFCPPLKVVTKSLPPLPPCLECVVVSSSSLKLKWRDSRYIDLTQYILEMQRSDGRYAVVLVTLSLGWSSKHTSNEKQKFYFLSVLGCFSVPIYLSVLHTKDNINLLSFSSEVCVEYILNPHLLA